MPWLSHWLVSCILYSWQHHIRADMSDEVFYTPLTGVSKVKVSLIECRDETVLQTGIPNIKIPAVKEQFIKRHCTHYPVQLKGKPVCYDTT